MSASEGGAEQGDVVRMLDVMRALITSRAAWELLLIGAVVTGKDRMRMYFRSPDRDRTYGVDVVISHTGPGLLASLTSPPFLANEHLHQLSDDPHCDVIVDLTDY